MQRRKISIRDLAAEFDKDKGITWRDRYVVPAGCLAIIAVCVDRFHIRGREIGVAPGTLKRFQQKPGEDKRVELRTLTLLMLCIGLKSEVLTEYGLEQCVVDGINRIRDEACRRFDIVDYDPESDFAIHAGDENDQLWSEIAATARSRIRSVADEAAVSPLFLPRPSPIKTAILDLISNGSLPAGKAVSTQNVKEILEERAGFANVRISHIENALDCIESHGHTEIRNGVHFVKVLSPTEWFHVTGFRSQIESYNIELLLDNPIASREVLIQLRGWLSAMRTSLDASDIAGFFAADVKFHFALAMHSEPAFYALSGLLPFIRRAAICLGTKDVMLQLLRDHEQIFDCISKVGDEQTTAIQGSAELQQLKETAREAIKRHLQHSCDFFTSRHEQIETHD